MANLISALLTNEEKQSLYSVPSLNDAERQEYFAFSNPEIKVLYSFE